MNLNGKRIEARRIWIASYESGLRCFDSARVAHMTYGKKCITAGRWISESDFRRISKALRALGCEHTHLSPFECYNMGAKRCPCPCHIKPKEFPNEWGVKP